MKISEAGGGAVTNLAGFETLDIKIHILVLGYKAEARAIKLES